MFKIIPQGPAYNVTNRAGNPLTFDAEILLTTLPQEGAPPFSFAAVPPVVWRGAMHACTFESLEEFIGVIADPYGATDGRLTLTTDDGQGLAASCLSHVIEWDCDRGYGYHGLAGADAVGAVAAALTAPARDARGGHY